MTSFSTRIARLVRSPPLRWLLAISLILILAAPARAAEFPAVIELSSLNGANGFQVVGVASDEQHEEYLYSSVAGACDVNGDGTDDLIIGRRFSFFVGFTGPPPNKTLSSYVVFGKSRRHFPRRIDLAHLNGRNGFRLKGMAGNGACAGDVNGDGVADLIIGSSHANPRGLRHAGSTYVVFGRKAKSHGRGFPATIKASDLDGTNGFRLDGQRAGNQSGFSVAGAGDVNGDGFSDVIIGAPGFSSRSSYVVFGKASGFAAHFSLGRLNGGNGFRIDSLCGVNGRSVASAGDINDDGFADVIIGDPDVEKSDCAPSLFDSNRDGSAFVVLGKASPFPAHIDLALLNGTDGFRLVGGRYHGDAGISVASAGDVNSDGIAEMIIGAPNEHDSDFSDRSYVVYGNASGFAARIELPSLAPPAGFQLGGLRDGEGGGSSVAGAGDVNGDGFSDVIIGAPSADPKGRLNAGSSYVVFGKKSDFDSPFSFSTLDGSSGFRLDGGRAGAVSGISVASAGDVNGDRVADLIIGAIAVDVDGRYHGARAYVVFGRKHKSSR